MYAASMDQWLPKLFEQHARGIITIEDAVQKVREVRDQELRDMMAPPSDFEVLREKHVVTEWIDGLVGNTQFLDYVWLPMEDGHKTAPFEETQSDGSTRSFVYCTPSTSYKGETVRRKQS